MGLRRALNVVGIAVALTACASSAREDAAWNDSSLRDVDSDALQKKPLPSAVKTALRDAMTRGPLATHRTSARELSDDAGIPIFEPGNEAPALYQVDLAPGWAIVTATTPAHVLELGTEGEGPATRARRTATRSRATCPRPPQRS